MKQFVLGFFAALLSIGIIGGGYFALGLAPVATSSSPMPFERTIAHIALKAAMDRSGIPKTADIQPTQDVYLGGAHIYRNDCAVCHGLPGQE